MATHHHVWRYSRRPKAKCGASKVELVYFFGKFCLPITSPAFWVKTISLRSAVYRQARTTQNFVPINKTNCAANARKYMRNWCKPTDGLGKLCTNFFSPEFICWIFVLHEQSVHQFFGGICPPPQKKIPNDPSLMPGCSWQTVTPSVQISTILWNLLSSRS